MASQRLSESDLKNMGLTWSEVKQCYVKASISNTVKIPTPATDTTCKKTTKFIGLTPLRTISLKLFGEPMPKQSVRSFIRGKNIMHYQPQEKVDRTNDYIRQVRAQIPVDWTPFETRVHVTKFHCIYSPLKSFSKAVMNRIEAGEMIYKETQPDLIDNLKKLVFDSMAGIVYKNDGMVVSEDNVKKYYGTGGMILIELSGF